jgi:CheY-like chemotaxis protein
MNTTQGKKVMLVEDDAAMLAVLSTLLEIEGFQVLSPQKKSLDEIVQAIRSDQPDTILLDVHLRDVSGYDVIEQVRKDPQINQVRVVMTSGMDVEDQCIAAGANDFLLKPYMPDELITKLQG